MKKMFWMLCLLSLHITAQTVGENGATDDYAYDASGNLIRDANKNITNITYNHLNLPVVITFSNGDKIVYLYNAVGEKRQKKVTVGDKTTVTDYLGGFQYEDGELKFFQHEEGYVAVTNSDSGMDFTYVYNYTDHLGNVRLSWAKDNTTDALKIIRESHYYPFGLEHKGYNTQKYAFIVPQNGISGIWTEQKKAIVNPYRYSYNGKEFQHELRLNLYDYGARNYDPAIGRWMNIDPLAEKSRRFSPYVYALDNPVYFIDPDGMQAISTSNIYDDRIQMTTAVGNEKYGENDGDYFNKNGTYLGSDNKNDKAIYITNTTTLGGQISPFNAPKGFYNNDGSVNEGIAQGVSKSVRQLAADDRIQAAGGIYNHYYQEAGYNLKELKSGKIDDTKGGWESALSYTKLGGVTGNSNHLGKGERAVEISYGGLGLVLNNGYDVLNLISHEGGKHMEDLNMMSSGVSLGKWQLENRAALYQLQDSSWPKTSPEFKSHIKYNMSPYLTSEQVKKYFK